MHHLWPLKNCSMWQRIDCTCINLGKVTAESIDLHSMSKHFNGGMVSLDKAMVFKDPPCERSLVKAKIVHTPMMCIKAWSCATKNGLEMHLYRGCHWSRYWFASHKQGHCLEMYPYAFPMGFNLGLVPLDQAFVFN